MRSWGATTEDCRVLANSFTRKQWAQNLPDFLKQVVNSANRSYKLGDASKHCKTALAKQVFPRFCSPATLSMSRDKEYFKSELRQNRIGINVQTSFLLHDSSSLCRYFAKSISGRY
jgi:hypothetical protein